MPEAAGLDSLQLAAAAWAIAPDGRRYRAAGAILAALDELLPGGLQLVTGLYRLPVVRSVADAVYQWTAANRHRLPGRPALPAPEHAVPLDERDRRELARRLGDDGAESPEAVAGDGPSE